MDVCAYFDRIGYDGVADPTIETLRELHRLSLRAIPFENLDIHLGRPISLDPEALFDKIVRRRRGGFCYELNGLFAEILRAIGFDLDLLSARVAHQDGSFGREFDHLLLRVRLDGKDWIADVGFGDSFLEPLLLYGYEQDCCGTMYLIDTPKSSLLLLRKEQEQWRQQYLFTATPRQLQEFDDMCVYHQTSPMSSFTRGRVVTRATADGRITLSEMRLIQTSRGDRKERGLESEAEYLEMLQQHFGIVLQNPAWKVPALQTS
jgi:N-hydroxyarylamine O-acetyltransferase